MRSWAILHAVALVLGTTAQSNDEESSDIAFCNSTFTKANGVSCLAKYLVRERITEPLKTGFFPIDPEISFPLKGHVPNATWAISLSAGIPFNTTVQSILWYNTGGLDYSDSLSLGFDVCAIYLGLGASKNTNLRSQHDDGSCLAILDASCIEALQRQAEEAAMQLVGSPSFLSDGNLTAKSVVGVCDEIARTMTSALPQPCKPYYNETKYDPTAVALATGYNSTGLFFGSPGDPCMLKTANNSKEMLNGVFDFQAAEANGTSHTQYDSDLSGVYGVYAVLTVFMPVANLKREVFVTRASSKMTYLRVTDYNPGSRIPASRGQPTPVLSAGGVTLIKGEIAGVVVAVVVGFGLRVIAVLMWWLRRRRTSRAIAQSLLSNSSSHEKTSQVAVATKEIGDSGARHELDPANQRLTELPDVGSNNPLELEGSNAEDQHTGRLPS
ncbi:hypothetical protein Q7P35_005694 [Cladosporium inversicolor]